MPRAPDITIRYLSSYLYSTHLAALVIAVVEAVVDAEHGDVTGVLMERHRDLELAARRRRADLQTASVAGQSRQLCVLLIFYMT